MALMTKEVAQLLRQLRNGHGQKTLGLLAVEVLLHVAERPQTIEELVVATGVQNAHVNRAVLSLTPWYDRRRERVVCPELHLLQRRKRPQAKGYRVHLTARGREILAPVVVDFLPQKQQ
jgi:hypothetical protein